jgi:hypothetical protein
MRKNDETINFQRDTRQRRGGDPSELTLKLRDEHYPFWSKGRLNNVKRVDLLARSTQKPVLGSLDIFADINAANNAKKGTLTKDASLGNLLIGPLTAGLPATPTGEVKLFLDTRALSDVWLAVTWSGQ